MSCDLQRIYGNLASQLPTHDREPFALDETNLPILPAELTTDRMWIRRGYIEHLPGCRGDLVDVVAQRSLFREFGLLALAVMFHESCNRVTIHVTATDSVMRHVVIEHMHWAKSRVSGFRVRPWVLGYGPLICDHHQQRLTF
jgi:hypothetical protein